MLSFLILFLSADTDRLSNKRTYAWSMDLSYSLRCTSDEVGSKRFGLGNFNRDTILCRSCANPIACNNDWASIWSKTGFRDGGTYAEF